MTYESSADVADLAGVLVEVARLEALAAALDARLDSSLGAWPQRQSAGPGGGVVIDLRQGVHA